MTTGAAQKPALSSNDQRVLRILREAKGPLSAYEIMARFKEAKVAPPTVYRALNHLTGAGLAHRLESCNAFIACAHDSTCRGATVFMLCADCGQAIEYHDQEIEAYLRMLAEGRNFRPRAFTLELQGLCGACEAAPPAAESAPA